VTIRPRLRDALWMAAGAGILLLLGLLALLFGQEPAPNAQLAVKAQRVDLVGRMQLDLVSASEAEKSAVLAITDRESQEFADQARASTTDVERELRELAELLNKDGTQDEKDLLAEFSRRFTELRKVDDELLTLAVQNTNLKAYAVTSGPALGALDEMSAALSRLVAANADAPDAKKVMSLALGAEIGALRIQTLLPPHIAEASDARMSELEALMGKEDEQVRSDLDGLRALPKLSGDADLAAAASRYAEFRGIESQVIALSRENTNVRSLSISLNQKRKAMLDCHDVLSKLEEAIRKEPIEGVTYGGRFRPR
jgi:hypothetical protein